MVLSFAWYNLYRISYDEFIKDFLRGLMVRYVNPIWPFWDLEGTYPEYAEFQLADNILHLIYNQGVLWMACYFSPVFPLIHLLKIICLFYLRAWSGLRIVTIFESDRQQGSFCFRSDEKFLRRIFRQKRFFVRRSRIHFIWYYCCLCCL